MTLRHALPIALGALLSGPPCTALAQAVDVAPPPGPTYADLADLADPATVVARVQIRKTTRIDPVGAMPGTTRMLIEARTQALLVGQGLGETVRYLADIPLDARGRLPSLGRRVVLVFARPVPGRSGELQLVAPDAQLAWSPSLESRTRGILAELVAPGAAPPVLAVREAMHVPGNLVGEGETQIFMATRNDAPVSITVISRPGAPRSWGVSLSEIVDQAARPPVRETLTWYRLACFLPETLGPGAVPGDGGSPAADERAAADYRFVRSQLGACPRTRPAAYRQ